MHSSLRRYISILFIFLVLPAIAHSDQAGYDDGFYIKSSDGKFQLIQNGRLQLRYALQSIEEDGEQQLDQSAFSIPRAYVVFKANLFDSLVKCKFEINFGNGWVYIKDAWADYNLLDKELIIRAGQFKRPFSRQLMNSSGKLSFTERAITNSYFHTGRDIGIALHNNYESSPPFEWVVAVANGSSIKSQFHINEQQDQDIDIISVTQGGFTNVTNIARPAIIARVGYNYGGIKGYQEADLQGGPLRFSIGYSSQFLFKRELAQSAMFLSEIDILMKLYGFSLTSAGYLALERDSSNRAQNTGVHIQMSYLLTNRIESVARYSLVWIRDTLNEQEIGGGLNVYFYNHKLKWQNSVYVVGEKDDPWKTYSYILQSQFQLAF